MRTGFESQSAPDAAAEVQKIEDAIEELGPAEAETLVEDALELIGKIRESAAGIFQFPEDWDEKLRKEVLRLLAERKGDIPLEETAGAASDAPIRLHREAEALIRGDTVEIDQKMEANRDAFEKEHYGEIGGPSYASFQEIIDKIAEQAESAHDFALIDSLLRETIDNVLRNQVAIVAEAKEAWEKARGALEELRDLEQQEFAPPPKVLAEAHKKFREAARFGTTYMYFAELVSAGNLFDQGKGGKPRYQGLAFRRWGVEKQNMFSQKGKTAATANGFIFNILFGPDHKFRPRKDIEKLVSFIEEEARKRSS